MSKTDRIVTREPATLIILAGGESKRMGFPKHRLDVDGRNILTHLLERLGGLFVETVAVGRGIASAPEGVRIAQDQYSERGALVGIHGGLSASRTGLTFVVACDMPYVEPSLVEYLLSQSEGADIVVPVVRGYYEPLCAVYRTTCIEHAAELIESDVMKIVKLYPLVRVHEATEQEICRLDPELRSFVNLNAPTQTNLTPGLLD